MTENTESKNTSKLEISKPDDFKFRVAYDVYSRAWDDNPSDTIRLKLNELISLLSNDNNYYSDFYGQISQYRKDTRSHAPGRVRIETQRKRDWQRSDKKDSRNRRHK